MKNWEKICELDTWNIINFHTFEGVRDWAIKNEVTPHDIEKLIFKKSKVKVFECRIANCEDCLRDYLQSEYKESESDL